MAYHDITGPSELLERCESPWWPTIGAAATAQVGPDQPQGSTGAD